MKLQQSALLIQRAWRRYNAPTCTKCLLPVSTPYSNINKGYCMCYRCPGCLKFSNNNLPCSTECSPWFPPMDSNSDFTIYDDGLYEQWVTGRPICSDHLGFQKSVQDDPQENICIVS